MIDNNKVNTIKRWLGFGSINIVGRPLAGKDFQAKEMAKMFEANFISSGDILRNANNKTVNSFINNGFVAPSNLFLEIMKPYIGDSKYDNKPIILSGFGRRNGEQEEMLKILENSNHKLKLVIYLDISKEESERRRLLLKKLNDRGERQDDEKDTIEIRQIDFETKTMPIIDFYKKNNLLITIDGIAERQTITENIIDQIYQKIINLVSASR